MKTLKTLALSAFSLLGIGLAQAQQPTVIRLVASNGDRTPTQTAIGQILDPGWTFHGTAGKVTGGNAELANNAAVNGVNFGTWNGSYQGNPVLIKVNFAGALAGVAAVAGGVPQRFVVSNATESDTGNLPNPLTGTQEGVDYEVGVADFGLSTNFQTTSPFIGEFEGVQYSPIIEEIVGISPLGFYASPGFPSSVTNITTQQARLLYESGSVPLAIFTGDWANDANKIVYAIGRNTDAGQRFAAYLELGYDTSFTPKVWQPTISGGTTVGAITYGGTVTSHRLWPSETVSGIFQPLGGGGYNSGANLARVLTVTLGPDAYKGKFIDENGQEQFLYPDAVAGYYIGYITPGDANNRVLGLNGVVPEASRGSALAYNGVPLHDGARGPVLWENVRTGRYTAWLYNRILKPQSGLSGLKLQFVNGVRDQIRDVTASLGGIRINDPANPVFVERFTDGGAVVPK